MSYATLFLRSGFGGEGGSSGGREEPGKQHSTGTVLSVEIRGTNCSWPTTWLFPSFLSPPPPPSFGKGWCTLARPLSSPSLLTCPPLSLPLLGCFSQVCPALEAQLFLVWLVCHLLIPQPSYIYLPSMPKVASICKPVISVYWPYLCFYL